MEFSALLVSLIDCPKLALDPLLRLISVSVFPADLEVALDEVFVLSQLDMVPIHDVAQQLKVQKIW